MDFMRHSGLTNKNQTNSSHRIQFSRQKRLSTLLVGGYNPFEKYWPKRESSPNRDEHQK